MVLMLRDWFMEIWFAKLVRQLQSEILTNVNNQESELKDDGPIVLNDNDVNRMFGWALFKLARDTKRNATLMIPT